MTIELINQVQYDRLLQIQKDFPILTFDNNGFEYIDKSKFTEADKNAFDEVTDILKKHIRGFSKFYNFKIRKSSNEIELRFDYDWTYEDRCEGKNVINFIGVGYLEVKELLNGFNKNNQ